MQKKLLIVTGFFGVIAVILGAFGAHALASKLTESQLKTYHTGIHYHYYHTLALFALSVLAGQFKNNIWIKRSALFFVTGIVFFSGSIYLLACKELLSLQNWTWIIGPITPIGGIFFILGWTMLLLLAINLDKTEQDVLDQS